MKFKVASLKRKAEPDCAENGKSEIKQKKMKDLKKSDSPSESKTKYEATVPVKSVKKESSCEEVKPAPKVVAKAAPTLVKTPVKSKKTKDEKPVPKVIQTIAKPDKKDSIRNSTPKEDKPVPKGITKTMSLALALAQTQVVAEKKVLPKPTSVKFVPAKGTKATNSITKLSESSESESEEKLSPELSLIFEDLKRKINDKLEEPPKPKIKKVENEKSSNEIVNKPKKHKAKKIKKVQVKHKKKVN